MPSRSQHIRPGETIHTTNLDGVRNYRWFLRTIKRYDALSHLFLSTGATVVMDRKVTVEWHWRQLERERFCRGKANTITRPSLPWSRCKTSQECKTALTSQYQTPFLVFVFCLSVFFLFVLSPICLFVSSSFVFFVSLSFCYFFCLFGFCVLFVFSVFVSFLSFSLDMMLIKCVKGFKSQSHSLCRNKKMALTQWPRSGIKLPGQLKSTKSHNNLYHNHRARLILWSKSTIAMTAFAQVQKLEAEKLAEMLKNPETASAKNLLLSISREILNPEMAAFASSYATLAKRLQLKLKKTKKVPEP